MQTKLLQMIKKTAMDNALQHYIFMYIFIISIEVLEAGVFKDFRVVLLQSKI